MMMEQVCRLMNNKYEDEYKGVSIDNYVDLLGIVMILVDLWYGFFYIWGYNGDKQNIFVQLKVGNQAEAHCTTCHV